MEFDDFEEGNDAFYVRSLQDCIGSGLHLTSCDDDGYCNHCGHQESREELYID